jgi:hydrogenase assembly chaperone HypC/HupF
MCLAFPGRVVAVDPFSVLVDIDGERRRATTFLVPDLVVGDWVAVAGDSVIRRLSGAQAQEIQALLREAIDRASQGPAGPSRPAGRTVVTGGA